MCVCVFVGGSGFIRLRALGFGVSLTLNPMNLNPVGAQVNRFAGFGGWQGEPEDAGMRRLRLMI